MSMGAFAEAALVIVEAEDPDVAREQADQLVTAFVTALFTVES